MNYKGIQYQIVRTANPTGWKWTVLVDGRITGFTYNREEAVKAAERAIDKLRKDSRKPRSK